MLEEGGRVGGTEAGEGRDVCGMMGVGRRRDAGGRFGRWGCRGG